MKYYKVTIPHTSRIQNFQEIPPQSRIMENIVPDFKTINLHPPGTRASVAQLRANGAKNTSQKRTTHSYLSTLDLEELEVPIMVVPTSKRKMATKSKEEKMEMEILQTTKIQMMMMVTKKVEMKTLQMLMDTSCQETTLANKPLLS